MFSPPFIDLEMEDNPPTAMGELQRGFPILVEEYIRAKGKASEERDSDINEEELGLMGEHLQKNIVERELRRTKEKAKIVHTNLPIFPPTTTHNQQHNESMPSTTHTISDSLKRNNNQNLPRNNLKIQKLEPSEEYTLLFFISLSLP